MALAPEPERARDDYLATILEPDPFGAREVVREAAESGLADGEVPDVVALSTTIQDHLPGARDAVAALRDLGEPPLVAVGGQAYGGEPDARGVGADLWAASAGVVPALVRERVPPL